MKSLTLKVQRIKEFEINPYRRWVGLFSILFGILSCFLILYSGISGYISIVLAIPILISLPEFFKLAKNDFKNEILSAGECILEFGESELVCKYNNTTKWRIPFGKLSHIETNYIGTGKWFGPKLKETFIYTNIGKNDSYPLPGAINEEDQNIIQKEILAAKNIKNV